MQTTTPLAPGPGSYTPASGTLYPGLGQTSPAHGTVYPTAPRTRPPLPPTVTGGVARLPTRGTVYGGQTSQPTSGNADGPTDSSGSLTGLIMSRGQPARPEPRQRSRLLTVLITTASVLVFIAGLGLVVYVLAGDFLRGLVDTLIRH
jgi:hypothetical protein